MVSRRAFLAGTTLLSACGVTRAPRYHAWLFVASAGEKAVVVTDLASFHRSGAIDMGTVPNQVLSARGKVFAVCDGNQSVVRIDPVRQTVVSKVAVGGRIVGAALTTGGDYLVVATSQPSAAVLIDTGSGKIIRRTGLAGIPFAIAAADAQAAILLASKPGSEPDYIARLKIPDGVLLGVSATGSGPLRALNYRKDGRTIFVAAPDARQIVTLDAMTGSILARLPVPIRPARFCTDGTGGQVFVTGADREDQLVIFSPFQNQVDQTLYAGRSPFGMAVAAERNLLFLTSPEAGSVTIVDIDTRGIRASVRTGGNPREILIASTTGLDEEYAFVVDGDTGDVSVIHIPVVLQKPEALIADTPKPVFTVFHGGSAPQSAVIVPYSTSM